MKRALEIGTAGEHLVCADLILRGYKAFLSSQFCAYDVAVDVGGKIIRVQVKSTLKPRPLQDRKHSNLFYSWHSRQGITPAERTARLRRREFDYYAFVALDISKIAYVRREALKGRTIFQIKFTGHPSYQGRTFDHCTFVPR